MSSSRTSSQQQSTSLNNDARIAATDQSRVVASGGALDESLHLTDASQHFNDESLDIQYADSSTHNTDNSQTYVDNSTHTTLDAEVAKSAFESINKVAGSAIAGNSTSLEAALKANADTTKLAFDFGRTALEKTDAAVEKLFGEVSGIAERAQTGATADTQLTGTLGKTALVAAAVIGAAIVLK